MADVALLAVALAEVPLGFQRVERACQRRVAGIFGACSLERRAVAGLVVLLDRGGVGEHRFRRFQPDAVHRLAEQRAVLGLVDGGAIGADHLDIVAVEHAHALERQRGVERGLAAHGRQQRFRGVGPLLGDDLATTSGVIGSI